MSELVISAVVVVGILGLIIGLLLGVASIFLKVKVDDRVQQVYEALPHFNCGACGYPGCQGMAEGLVKSEAPISNCKPSKPAQREQIKKILDDLGIKNKM